MFETLLKALRQQDWEEARGAAHWLQGGATRLIDRNLQQEFQSIEKVCAGDAPAFATETLEALQSSFVSACVIAKEWLSEYRQSPSLIT
jgi:HPt (histidine-containing phosphotransfer) domain-containing protein